MDTIFYIAGKTVWLLIRPETLLVVLIAVPLVCLWLGRIVAASRFLVMALIIMIAIGVIPVGNFVLNPLERAYAPNPPITQASSFSAAQNISLLPTQATWHRSTRLETG